MKITRRKRFVIAGIALGAALLFLVTSSPFQQWLLRRAESWAAGAGYPFKAERLSLDFTELKASLNGLRYEQAGQNVRVENLQIDLPWDALRGGDIRITSLEADGVFVDIRASDSQPGQNTSASPPAPGRRLRIDRLSIRNASVSYSSAKTALKIPSLSIEAKDGRGVVQLDTPASISPNLTVTVGQLPFAMGDDDAQFGPTTWKVQHAKYGASGSAEGLIRWSPKFSLETQVTTDPITVKEFKDIRLNAKATYADGELDVTEFRASHGRGDVAGSAKISGAGSSSSLTWKDLDLAPAGVIARTHGTLQLKWQRSDFTDISGQGKVSVDSRDYGLSEADIQIADAKITVNARTRLPSVSIRTQISTELDRLLAGDFTVFRGTARGSIQPLAKGTPYERLGSINVAAAAVFQNNTLTVRGIEARSNRSTASGATLRVNLTNKRIQGNFPRVRVDLQDMTADASGAIHLSASVDGSISQPSASFTGTSEGLTIRNVPVDELKIEGALATVSSGEQEIKGKVSGTVHPLTTLQPSGTLLQGFQSINFSANGTFRENILTIDDVQAQSSASSLSGAKFQANFANKQIGGTIPTFRLNLTDVSSEVTGNAYLSADAAGTIDQPIAAFKVFSDGLDIRGNHIDAVEVEGSFANNSVAVTRVEARRADGVANATGSFNLATQEVQGQANVADLKIIQVPDLSGTAFLNAQIKGNYPSPTIEFNGDVRDVRYKEQEHGDVHFEGSTDLKAATLQATSGKYAANLSGQIRLEAPYAFTAGLISNQSQISYGEYNVMADGRARISGEAQPFKATYIELDNFHVRGEGIELMANGPINPGTEVQLSVNFAELPIQGVELEGMARGLATISGNWKDPSIKGSLVTDGATVRTPQMTEPADVSARVEFTGRDLTIPNLRATYAGATATITGNGSWSGSGTVRFRIDDLRPENLAPGKGVTGTAGLEGEIDIANLSLDGISGHAKVTEFSIKVRDAEIHQKQPLELEFRNQLLTVKQFEIEGLETYAQITGYADLRDQSLHFDADADTDLAILEPFIPNSRPQGRVKTRFALRGTTGKPNLEGEVSISDGELLIERPDVELSEVNVDAELRGDRLELKRATGLFNGGPFEASGGTGLSDAGLQNVAFRAKADRSQLQYPDGLQSEISSELMLTGTMPNLTLTGRVDVLNAIYQKDFKLGQELFSRITTSSRLIGPTAESGGLADQIRMEIEVQTPGPIVVKNNVAELEAEGTFRVRGTVANPILLGRAVVKEGGELYFGPTLSSEDLTQRSDRYIIDRGSIDFNNPLRTDPELDFRATHELEVEDERYLITLGVTGTPETLKVNLTSDPYLEESDIVVMLLTGRTFEELQGTYANFAGEQALGYVSGQLSERVLSQAGNVVGLSTIRVDPVSIADQTDLAARLTVAKEVTDEFEMIYSHTLNDAKSQTWILSYKPFQNLVFRGISDADQNEAIVDVKHDLTFGGGDALLKRKRPESEIRLRNVTFAGTHFGEKDLLKQVTKEGSAFGPYRVSQDVRNIRRFLASQGYPQSKVRAQQSTEARNADVHFDITEGPRIVFAYEGAEVPESVRKEIQQLWALRSSDAASMRDSTARLLRHFRSQGYVQAHVSASDPATVAEGRHYTFKIEPGLKFDKPLWVFKGIEPMDIPEPAGEVMENPVAIKQRIEAHFRNSAYLDVKSTVPELVVVGAQAHFEVTVDRGKPYTVGTIEFEGNEAFTAQHLREVIGGADARPETPGPVHFTYQWLETARQHLTSEYWKSGYNDVQIVPSTSQNPEVATANVRFQITEGELQRIEAIEIAGRPLTSRAFIESQFEFKEGDPVDQTKVNLTRKKLYDTRLFRRVEIEMVRGTTGYIARVTLTENAPWQLRYGIAVTEHLDDGERDTGVSADLTYKNLFRRGVITGVSGKVDADDRDLRWFTSFPQLLGRKVTTSLTFFRTIEDADTEELVDYWGGTIQQQWRFGRHYLLSYDYSHRRVLKGERPSVNRANEEDTILDDPRIPIARFDVTISRDTRDDILNAKRGTFVSNSFEIAPKGIGSSVEFIRNYSQFMHFTPVKKFVFASAIRFGVAQSLGDSGLDSTLQFRTGGSTTVRAFEKDELTKAPGDYELVLNGELRFPIFWRFSGATFIDAGQVAVRGKDLFRFRYGPGIGIRIDTPFLMFRTDLGLNIDPRDEFEAKGRWWFGIGQAF